MTFKEKLIELRACNVAIKWAADKTIEEVWQTCERGDWMLWLAKKADIDIRTLTLAKARCAELAIPYMTDERSINAVKVALAFGRGEATMEELKAAVYASADAYAFAFAAASADADAYAASAASADAYAFAFADAYAASAYASASAFAAAYAADASASAFAAAYAFAAASAAADATADATADARKETLKKCADIVREVISVELIKANLNTINQ